MCKSLSKCYEENSKASILLAYITTSIIVKCKGSMESFMLNWQKKLRQYELLVNADYIFSNAIKLTILQNAASSVE